MKLYRAVLAALALPLAACAQGTDGDPVDAPGAVDGPEIDGPEIDGPEIDGPEIDAPEVDAPEVDAPEIDAPMIDAPMIDAPMVDAPIDAPIDAPMIDAPIDGGPLGNADTCATAVDITAAAMMPGGTVVSGNLTGYANDIQPTSACTGFTNDGPDAIYVLSNLTAGRTITASVTAPWDSAVEIVQPCTFTPTCLAGQDNGDPEQVTHVTAAAGTFYVIVDSWDVSAYGPYTLTVSVQ